MSALSLSTSTHRLPSQHEQMDLLPLSRLSKLCLSRLSWLVTPPGTHILASSQTTSLTCIAKPPVNCVTERRSYWSFSLSYFGPPHCDVSPGHLTALLRQATSPHYFARPPHCTASPGHLATLRMFRTEPLIASMCVVLTIVTQLHHAVSSAAPEADANTFPRRDFHPT
jgi:hypothetical protein